VNGVLTGSTSVEDFGFLSSRHLDAFSVVGFECGWIIVCWKKVVIVVSTNRQVPFIRPSKPSYSFGNLSSDKHRIGRLAIANSLGG